MRNSQNCGHLGVFSLCLNRIVVFLPSRRSVMKLSSVQKQAQFSFGGELCLLSFHAIEIAGETAVVAVAMLLFYVPVLFRVDDRTLDRVFGKTEVCRNRFVARPVFALGGRHALGVHINCFDAVWQAVICIDSILIADGATSYVLMLSVGSSADGAAVFQLQDFHIPLRKRGCELGDG